MLSLHHSEVYSTFVLKLAILPMLLMIFWLK
ncbi:hypothetical protein swp_0609 [Shewanella piezotolerans WP3]|uniref:Uncharacterized protein n=1 Tax=Shewanella piezotolerans (strain WP3 / JCM 13877) TaxID=225849 RepID=B8CIF5_SHEPW|nr:hypothetical protein swp_0609 [Shewanella piezotolerans WP3]